MPTTHYDDELDRLQGERDHLLIKLSMARDSGVRDEGLIDRIKQSLEVLDASIERRRRETKGSGAR